MFFKSLIFFLISLFFLHVSVRAEEPSLLSFGGGIFEVVRNNSNQTAEFRLEYKPGVSWYTLRPLVGFMMTIRGATYLYAGAGFDWVYKMLFFSPNFAAGWYNKGGGKDLGYPLEFRSGVEGGFRFPNCSRIGAHFYHISNASIGHKNPGEESLVFFFAVPLSCCPN